MLLTHSKIRPSCNARMMFDTPTGKMMTAIISMAMVNPKDNFRIVIHTPYKIFLYSNGKPMAPREKRLGEPYGSDLYKNAPKERISLSAL